jgi:pyruvyltransferase
MKAKLKLTAEHISALYKIYFLRHLPLFWFRDTKNFGDVLNIYLAEKLSQRKITWVNPSYWPFKHYLMIGSIVQFARRSSIIWGSGIISQEGDIPKPKHVLATRGPKSRLRFLENGIDCPEIYGDPAILLPHFYKPATDNKKWKLGVIPHYVDKSNALIQVLSKQENVHIIDIETDNIEGFVNELCQCEVVISSSLHGIILSEAYGIPAGWLKLSDKLAGGRFKFDDYYASTDRKEIEPIHLTLEELNIEHITSMIPSERPTYDTNKLLNACPFYKP